MPTRHIPERTCVICGTKSAKRDLVRLVRTPDGECLVDETGKRSGRGAYLCHRETCWEQAMNGGRLERALRGNLSNEDKERLRSYRQALAGSPEPTT